MLKLKKSINIPRLSALICLSRTCGTSPVLSVGSTRVPPSTLPARGTTGGAACDEILSDDVSLDSSLFALCDIEYFAWSGSDVESVLVLFDESLVFVDDGLGAVLVVDGGALAQCCIVGARDCSAVNVWWLLTGTGGGPDSSCDDLNGFSTLLTFVIALNEIWKLGFFIYENNLINIRQQKLKYMQQMFLLCNH